MGRQTSPLHQTPRGSNTQRGGIANRPNGQGHSFDPPLAWPSPSRKTLRQGPPARGAVSVKFFTLGFSVFVVVAAVGTVVAVGIPKGVPASGLVTRPEPLAVKAWRKRP